MLRAAAHMLSLGAKFISLAPGFSPVTHKTLLFFSSAAPARRKRRGGRFQKSPL